MQESAQNRARGQDRRAARIFVESFLGQIRVYTDLPGTPELHVVEAVWADPDQETLDNRAYLRELLEQDEIRELPKSPNWVLTDDACWQYRRRISGKRYELIGAQDLGMEYGIVRGVIDLDGYTLDEWEDYLQLYGHGNLRGFVSDYGNTLPLDILAEYIFETDWESFLSENRFPSLDEAERYIAGVVNCPLPETEGSEKA